MSFFYTYRKHLGLSQTAAAHRVGVPQQKWAAWEAGDRAAPMWVLQKVCPEVAPPDVTADHLKFFRRHLGLAITKAAELCGVSYHLWRSWEKGYSRPPAGFVFVLRNALKDPSTRPMTPLQLQRFRKTHNVTRAYVAEHFGVCEDTVAGWELGMEAMPVDMRERLDQLGR
ncbi:MAG: hypothetical protein RBR35_19680 [Salinivirgaceae bacterium]|nr:hypothetical protein [Salinivirgaceae bacterium]